MKTAILSALLCAILATPILAQEASPKQYICPMYCTDDVSTQPGTHCTVCDMEYEDKAVLENPKDHKVIPPDKAFALMQKDSSVFVLDVRTLSEYRDDGHLTKAVLIPIKELAKRLSELAPAKSKTIIAYCSHGIRSARAATLLQSKGFTVVSLIGGTTKWTRDKFPIVHK
jgi:rhodanese-related sulfurtransferase